MPFDIGRGLYDIFHDPIAGDRVKLEDTDLRAEVKQHYTDDDTLPGFGKTIQASSQMQSRAVSEAEKHVRNNRLVNLRDDGRQDEAPDIVKLDNLAGVQHAEEAVSPPTEQHAQR